MNGQEFYDLFKDSLHFLDAKWGEKEKITIYVKDNELIMECGILKTSFYLPKETESR